MTMRLEVPVKPADRSEELEEEMNTAEMNTADLMGHKVDLNMVQRNPLCRI